MKNHHLNFGGIQGSPKFPALVPCTLAAHPACSSGTVRSNSSAADKRFGTAKIR
jgi:hypothetical protein